MQTFFFTAPITFNLLVLNILISALTFLSQPQLIEKWGMKPYDVRRHKEWYRFITSGFLHGSWMHLLFNMITLWSFGPYMEQVLGSIGFLAVYMGSELAANALTYYKYKNNVMYNAVGASGAISGILLGFVLFEPFRMLVVLFFPMPAIVFAILYIAASIYAAKSDTHSNWGNIAHEAHLGGAIGGLLLTIILKPVSLLIFLSKIAHFIGLG